jgi:hypothetical protein
MDYAALARQYGGTTATPAVDYAAIAKQFGGVTDNTVIPSESGVPAPRKTGGLADQIPTYSGPAPTVASAPSLTTGQKLYRNVVRPVIAPTIETLGAVGGGALGAPLGPAGIVAGSGLGYGAAKEALKLGDIYLGGQTPSQAQTEPVKNILEGATMEAGGKVAGQALGYVGGKIMDLRQIPKQKAAIIAQKAMGADLPEVLNALRNAPATASVAELTAKIENPLWQSLIKNALDQDPQFGRKMALMSERESRNALSKLAGGTTAADVRAAGETGKEALNALTKPMREAALNRANLGKEVARLEKMSAELGDQAAAEVQKVRQLINLGDNAAAAARLEQIKAGLPVGSKVAPAKSQGGFSDQWAATFTYPGKLAKMSDEWASKAATASLDLGQGARFANEASSLLRRSGIKPLEGKKIAQSVSALTNNPEFAGNDILAGAVKNVADDIAKWTNNGGVIDAKALEAIRKNSVNAAIAQLRPGVDATSQRNLAAGVMTKIKPMIDEAIENSGGVGWKDYLTSYSKGMQRLNEQKLTGEALQLWKTDKDAFVRLVQNESPDVVEKILGSGNYNIATELANDTLSVLQKQAQKRLTELSVKEQVGEGGAALSQLLQQESSRFRFPSFLSFWASAGNKTLSELEKAVGTRTMAELTKAMKSPESAANLLETLPATERNRVLNLLSNPQQWKPGAAAATVIGASNLLAPNPKNENALAR